MTERERKQIEKNLFAKKKVITEPEITIPKKVFPEKIKYSDEIFEVVITGNSKKYEWLKNREGEVLKVRKGLNVEEYITVDYVLPLAFGIIQPSDCEILK